MRNLIRRAITRVTGMHGSEVDREWAGLQRRYGDSPRYHETPINLGGFDLLVPDVASALSAYRAIFLNRIYEFDARESSPVILDCGANIGLSILYFKMKYPSARIIAFEPDPKIFRYLELNLEANGIDDVQLVPKALWSSETQLSFWAEGADAGRVQHGEDTLSVPATRSNQYFGADKIDLIKIDIEGAEGEALSGLYDELENVERVFVEYHSFPDRPQDLGCIIDGLNRAGFRCYIQSEFVPDQPFNNSLINIDMDMRLNMFFVRERAPAESRS